MIKIKKTIKKWKYILRLFRHAFAKYKRGMIILVVLGFIAGTLEGIGINALAPLLSLLVGTPAYELDLISDFVVEFFEFIHIPFALPYLLAFIVGLFIAKAVMLLLFQYVSTLITARYERETRYDLLKKTLKARWLYLVEQKIGYLETVIMTDVRQATVLLNTIIQVIMRVTVAFVYIVVAINIDFKITIISIVFGVTLTVIVKPLIKKTKRISSAIVSLNKKIAHYVNEIILGMKSVKVITDTGLVVDGADEHFLSILKQKVRLTLVRYSASMLIEPFAIIFISIYLLLSYNQPGFQFTSFLVVMYLIYKIFTYIKQIQQSVYKLATMFPYLEDVLAYQDRAAENVESTVGEKDFSFKDSIKFSNVDFIYPAREKEVLSDINLEIKKGSMIGIIGPSGSGKTTLVDLFLRLLRPGGGKILIDNVDSLEMDLNKWREQVGYVPQEVFLLNDTIANNVRFFDSRISFESIKRSIEQAGLVEFVESLPDDLDTIVGERGFRLSAGQRQRIHIARVLARDPEVLILDEATSALDNKSEQHVQKVIEGLRGEITAIVIAHRLSTVMGCDKIFVLEEGRITEQGSPGELLKDESTYFSRLYSLGK